jgi:RAD3-like DEAD/DEAH box helicase
MSLIPSAPFPICGNRRQCARCNREKILLRRSSLRSRFGGVGGYGGTSVVVQAPTGSGKTYIFELLYPNLKTHAVFTVPTRALVLDKHSNRYGSRHGCLYRKAVASVRDAVSIRNNESNWCPFSFGQMIRRCRFESLKQT